ncbi:MAG TPA: hypothetical protein VHN19_15880 [Burkholderiales bacterium]|jgi:hypothetical protein|nr:hypothetical protein [Burkholderiales bacterium]
MEDDKRNKQEANRDPLSGAPGAHPVGTGLGAAAGGMASGAAVGTVAGPIGTAVGAAVGAVVGGLAGKAIGEAMDPTVEDAHWRKAYSKESYYQTGLSYDDYAPAYRAGYEGRAKNNDRKFEDVEPDLEASYNSTKGASKLGWEDARQASRAAWDRVERAVPSDADRDGR